MARLESEANGRRNLSEYCFVHGFLLELGVGLSCL